MQFNLNIDNMDTLDLRLVRYLDVELVNAQNNLERLEKAYINVVGNVNEQALASRLSEFSKQCRTFAVVAVTSTPDLLDAQELADEFIYCAIMAEHMSACLTAKQNKVYYIYQDHYVA